MPRKKSLKAQFKAAPNKTAHFDQYKIFESDDPILMDVFPGDDGQSALTEYYLEEELIDDELVDNVEALLLGDGNQLNGKFLDVYTVVTDISDQTNLTSMTFKLTGGVTDYAFYMEKSVTEEGDSVLFKISIFFTSN